MQGRILEGKKIALLLETEYIAEEVNYYHSFFSALGAQVDDLTYLWGESQRTLVSDVVQPGQMPETMVVTKDIADAKVEEYDIVLCAANYVSCRLREIPPMGSLGSVDQLTTPPAVQFMIQAMDDSQIVKGALCHALWILTPAPRCLKGRKVICHTVVLADVVNAGGCYVPVDSHIVVDRDLVTGRSAADLKPYCQAILETWQSIHHSVKEECFA